MLTFKAVELEDRQQIEALILPRGLMNCDLSFANMYCWRATYRSEWALVEGFLVIRFRIDGGERLGYMQPIGEGDFGRIIPLLREDAHRLGEPLRLVGVTEEGWQQLAAHDGDRFATETDRAMSDYIYRAEELSRLVGKHYQPKRNHCNRFRTLYPEVRYEPLCREHFAACMELEREWCRQREGCRDAALSSERAALECALTNFEALGLRGGCLMDGERMVAFCYGSAVSEACFVIHAEKADTRYEGAFAAINRAFAEEISHAFQWINREEDLGIEGLRKAKLSYCPARLLDKYTAVELSDDARACRRLWEECFPSDERAFTDRFLLHYLREERMLRRTDEHGAIVAMVHTIPFRSAIGRIDYLYAVATDPSARGRGLASELIEEAVRRARERGAVAVALIPADEKLRAYYTVRGFEGDYPIRLHTPDRFDFGTGEAERDRAMLRWCGERQAVPEPLACFYCEHD